MKNGLEQIEEQIKEKAEKRDKKKKSRMKVSGKSVFKIQKLIRQQKSKKS